MIRVWSVEILRVSQSGAAPKHQTKVSKHLAWEQVSLIPFERKKREFPLKGNRRRPSSYTPWDTRAVQIPFTLHIFWH